MAESRKKSTDEAVAELEQAVEKAKVAVEAIEEQSQAIARKVAVTGMVAEVISDQELILNRGSDHGIREGDYFAILDPKAREVYDPETHTTLGGFKKVKIVVRATDVAPRLTLARTFRTRRVNVGGHGNGIASILSSMGEAPRWVDEVETFALQPDSPRPISQEESIIAIGDPFEKINTDNAEQSLSVVVD